MDFKNKSQIFNEYPRNFIDFNGKLRSIAFFGIWNLVLLLNDVLVIYKFE